MKKRNEEDIRKLLHEALPQAHSGDGPSRDLWPTVLRRMDEQTPAERPALEWLDGALLAGLIVFAAMFPATVPVILYYL